MKKVVYTCDKCGKELKDIIYTLSCYAKSVSEAEASMDDLDRIMQQNLKNRRERHLCAKCKDAITDGVFIV